MEKTLKILASLFWIIGLVVSIVGLNIKTDTAGIDQAVNKLKEQVTNTLNNLTAQLKNLAKDAVDNIANGFNLEWAVEPLSRKTVTLTHADFFRVYTAQNQVCGYDAATGKYFFHDYDEIPGLYHGTGDIFSAVLIGHLMKQESLSASTRQAMDVVREMIYRNRDVEDRCCGIFIERCLDLL